MGLQFSSLSIKSSELLIKKIPFDQEIIVTPIKLEIKPSTNSNAGLGVFALELIPKNTIFMEYTLESYVNKETIYFINDLAWNGDSLIYETDENIEKFVNVGFIRQSDDMYDYFGDGECKIFLYAICDIDVGEELSRFYSIDYWHEHQFWLKHSNSNYRQTHELVDLPEDWVFIDTIRYGYQFNNSMNLYAKKIQDNYYYSVGNGGNSYDPNFLINNTFIEITKIDYSTYAFDECIYDGMYQTKYLEFQYHKPKN